jgi:hypothetical protein
MGRHTKPHTGNLYQPTDEQRRTVLTMTGFGIRQEEIATSLQIDKKTLHKHFRRELDTGMTEANVRVAQALYTNATKHMSVGAQIWWTKARMGWKEAQDLNVGGTNTPLAIDFRWAPALPQTIEHDPKAVDADATIVVTFDTNGSGSGK